MKTNTIIVGITMMLLLALPAAASDYTLGVFGNANEDGTINMQDVTYTELIILEYRDQTELADAKYDGKINMQDVTQIELIILGKELELTVLQYIGTPPDVTEEPVTIQMPIERMVALSGYACEALCVFDCEDKIAGVAGSAKKMGEVAELIKDKEEVGSSLSPDIEKIMAMDSDVVVAYTMLSWYRPDTYKVMKEQLDSAGIPILLIDFYEPGKYAEEFRVLGYLLHNQERAEALINFEDEIHGRITDVVSEVPESEKPRACYSPHYSYKELEVGIAGSGTSGHNRIVDYGGVNVFEDIEGFKWVESEAVLDKNPEVFIKDVYTGWGGSVECGYKAEDSSSLEQARNLITSRAGWEHITAVENGDVYLICTHAGGIHPCIFDSYIAKWLHPDRFEDLDPIKIHEDWLNQFLGTEYQGVYAYPTPWTEES